MPNPAENLVYSTLARGATAELRQIVENCEDCDTARPIYVELKRLFVLMEKKHGFGRVHRPLVKEEL
jgi:hypothetical protein